MKTCRVKLIPEMCEIILEERAHFIRKMDSLAESIDRSSYSKTLQSLVGIISHNQTWSRWSWLRDLNMRPFVKQRLADDTGSLRMVGKCVRSAAYFYDFIMYDTLH